MIELDQTKESYVKDFLRFVNPPTHASIVGMRWGLMNEPFQSEERSLNVLMRPHIEAIYVFGRLNEAGDFMQTQDDKRHGFVHAGMDMTEYDVSLNIGTKGEQLDSPERLAVLEERKRTMAIRDTLIAHYEGPNPEDPAQRVPSKYPMNRFSEHDLDIVFGHTDHRLYGKAV